MFTASFITLSGGPYDQTPKWDMRTRGMAARNAGIESIGVSIHETLQPDVLNYVRVPECEWINIDSVVTPMTIDRIRRVRDILGVTRVNVGACGQTPMPYGFMAKQCAYIARATGITVAVEPVAFGSMRRVSEVLNVAEMSDDSRVGMLWDMWQVHADSSAYRSYTPDPSLIAEIQVCGVPEYVTFPRPESQDRPLMRFSQVDVIAWLRDLKNAGVNCPVSYEDPHYRPGYDLDQYASMAARDLSLLATA